VRHQCFPEQDT